MLYSVRLCGQEIPTYGVCLWLGVILSLLAACWLTKRRGAIPLSSLLASAFFTLLGAMVGAKLFYFAISWDDIAYLFHAVEYDFFERVFYLMNNGFVFYGGFLGGFLALFFYLKASHRSLAEYLTLYAVVLPLGHAVGRIGCFLGGCCYGVEYQGALAVEVPIYPTLKGSATVSRFPIQLVEAAGLLLLFFLLLFLYYRFLKKPTLPLWTYLAVYPVFRFVLEFWRGDKARGGFLIFSTSQWISLGIFLVAGMVFYLTQIRKKQE